MNDRVRESREQLLEKERPKRVPLRDQARNKLTVSNRDPNYEYRIVNDVDDRVARYKRAGWEIAPETVGFGDEEKNTSLGSGSRIPVGGGITGVLLRIRKEWYDEDVRKFNDDIDERERALLRSKNREDGLEGEIENKVHSRKVIKRKTV